MTLLQRYFWRQILSPLFIALLTLATIAILTQSLSTLELIVDNRQSALTFLYVTLLAVPQLIAVIMPLAVFMAMLYAFNRLNVDSELVVAKASGFSPGQIASPALRLATYAMIAHLLINLALQPYSFRKMREALFDIRTDIASQMLQSGQFTTPIEGLTLYAQEVLANGRMKGVVIYDSRDAASPRTYMAQQGYIIRDGANAQLILRHGTYQQLNADKSLHLLEVERDAIDLSDILALDTVLRLKATDQYLHELIYPDRRSYITPKLRSEFLAEGHARLSSPLYNIALTILALAFLVRGNFQRMGYGRRLAICAAAGFFIRLVGFSLTSASENNISLNATQYGWPILICCLSAAYLLRPNRKDGREENYGGNYGGNPHRQWESA